MFKPHTLVPLMAALCLGAAAASRDEAVSGASDSAEGFWVATTPGGVNVKWGILDGGETWGIYDMEGTILGAFHGNTRSSQGVLQGTGQSFDIPSRSTGSASYTGTYLPRQAISITTSQGASFSGCYVADYEQPASLDALAGRFSGEGLSRSSPVQGMRLSVAGSGALTMSSDEDCAASGTATPRPGGKNVFNVSLRFAGSACALGDGATATGIAHFSVANGELFVLAMNGAQTDGWLYLGARTVE